MPWKHHHWHVGGRKMRYVCAAVGAAVLTGLLAGLVGTLLQKRSAPLVEQYTRYKQVSSGYSKEEIKKAMEKMAQRGR